MFMTAAPTVLPQLAEPHQAPLQGPVVKNTTKAVNATAYTILRFMCYSVYKYGNARVATPHCIYTTRLAAVRPTVPLPSPTAYTDDFPCKMSRARCTAYSGRAYRLGSPPSPRFPQCIWSGPSSLPRPRQGGEAAYFDGTHTPSCCPQVRLTVGNTNSRVHAYQAWLGQ